MNRFRRGILSKHKAFSGAAMLSWIIWLIVAAVLGVAELLTMTFAFGLIAVAAVVAAAVGAFHIDLGIQLAAFVVAAAAGLGVVRPIAIRHLKQPPALRTGVAALIGRSAIVLEEVNEHSGRVRIDGEEYLASVPGRDAGHPRGHQSRRHADQGRYRPCLSPGVVMILAEVIIAAF